METKQKEGEGEKITSVPPVKESTKTETVISKVEQKFSPETKAKVAEVFKKPSGWQRKFLGIPVWGWIVSWRVHRVKGWFPGRGVAQW